ncbi:hypothetical protein KNH48_06330 [Heyndrickxia coagulans]|nr:hypothetical protein KNH48_06330 [Heyndrickxia coagulans]
MELFQMTRREMADLLLALKGSGPMTPAAFLQGLWAKKNGGKDPHRPFAAAVMPPFSQKY